MNFIPGGQSGQGSCSQVKELVTNLRRAGNDQVSGLIDWDLSNQSGNGVLVVGEGLRHSIENFVIDPCALGIYLLREQFLDPRSIGLPESIRFFDISSAMSGEMQAVARNIWSCVEAKALLTEPEPGLVKCDYVGSQQLEIPRWWLRCRGHDLEEYVKAAFPQLKRFRREGDLKKDVVKKIYCELPFLIPVEVLSALRKAQESGRFH